MTFQITSIYAALLAGLFLVLSVRVIGARQRVRALFGDGGDKDLTARIRAHGNCAEYVPLGLILLALAEAQGAPAFALHGLGLLLLGGRAVHAAGLSLAPGNLGYRVAGMVATFAMIGLTALGLLAHALIQDGPAPP